MLMGYRPSQRKLENGVAINRETGEGGDDGVEDEGTRLLVMPFGEPLDDLEISSGWIFAIKRASPLASLKSP